MIDIRTRAAAELELRRRKREAMNTPAMPLLDWMIEYRTMLSANQRFDLRSHRFLEEIYQSQAKSMVLYKSGQVGISEYLVSYALHACDQRAANVFYLFPTDTHVSDFSAQRIGGAIEEDVSPYLANIVVDGGSKSGKRGTDKVTQKRIRDSWLYLRGGKVSKDGKAAQLKSVPADVLIVDEVDELDKRAIFLAEKRLGHSDIAENRSASTPSYPGHGIHAMWLETDQRLYHLPCSRCSKHQDITINDIVIDFDDIGRPVAWHGQRDNIAFATCRSCSGMIDRTESGIWIATYGNVDVEGYHVTKLISPRVDLMSIVSALNTADESKRKEVYNQDLGLPHKGSGAGLSDSDLDACVRDYAHGVTDAKCYMGVDVGKLINVVTREAPDSETGERRQIHACAVTSFDEVAQLIKKHDPAIVVIDALPETRKARELQADFRKGLIWLAYYVGQKDGNKKKKTTDWHRKEGRVTIDRTRSLDEMVARFIDQENTLPANAQSLAHYYDQMKSSTRVIEDRQDGSQVARWVESDADHYFHAENYCMVASSGKPLSQMG